MGSHRDDQQDLQELIQKDVGTDGERDENSGQVTTNLDTLESSPTRTGSIGTPSFG